MKTITKQAAFNKVWNHFVVNKNPPGFDSITKSCTLRNKEGNKCPIGLLLSDEEINQIQEDAANLAGYCICLEEILASPIGSKFEDRESYFWLNLQEAHDFSVMFQNQNKNTFLENIKKWLEKTATEYNLNVPS